MLSLLLPLIRSAGFTSFLLMFNSLKGISDSRWKSPSPPELGKTSHLSRGSKVQFTQSEIPGGRFRMHLELVNFTCILNRVNSSLSLSTWWCTAWETLKACFWRKVGTGEALEKTHNGGDSDLWHLMLRFFLTERQLLPGDEKVRAKWCWTFTLTALAVDRALPLKLLYSYFSRFAQSVNCGMHL